MSALTGTQGSSYYMYASIGTLTKDWTGFVNKAFQIFKRDIKRLLRNPVALVITIGVCAIPSLYAWYNIAANWDPYGNTANVKVAVANEDAGTSNEYVGELNAGEQVVDQLHDNDQLGWTFVSASEAKQGVERGDYYAAVIIPKDFSENLTSMLTGEFTAPKLDYYVNEKKNAIAPKVTDKGASTIQEQINETFVGTATETLVGILKDMGYDVTSKVDTAESSLLKNIGQASDALGGLRDTLSGMQGTVDTTNEAIASADKTLAQLADSMPALETALADGSDLLTSTRATARDFSQSLSSAIAQGNVALGQASAHGSAAVGKICGVVAQAQVAVGHTANSIDGAASDIGVVVAALKRIDPTDSYGVQAILSEMQGNLSGVAGGLNDQAASITDLSAKLTGASSSIDSAVQTGIENVSAASDAINGSALPKLGESLDSFSNVAGDLSGALSSLAPMIEQARGTLTQLSDTLTQAKSAIGQTNENLAGVQRTLDSAATDISALRGSEALGQLADALDMDSAEVANFMSSPVELKTETIYPVANYGSGVAPFYTNLALWVGGFVLIAIFKLEVDPEGLGTFSAREGYFGRWLLMVLLGAVQALIVCVGDLVIGMQCGQPALFVLAGVWISFVYVNIIYAMAIAFKHIGKALAVVLVIVQIPGSSGMYPIEMMPGFYQWLHPLLPFTYGINAMRETIGGMYGLTYLANLGTLAVFLAVALVIGVVLRPLVLNLNVLFDRELAATGVMICESNDLPGSRFSVRHAMRALLDVDDYRCAVVERARRFEAAYPRRVKMGFGLVFGLPVLLFVLTSVLDLSVDGKIVMLVLWIAAIVLADGFLIALEYVRASLNTQMRISALTDEKLREEIRVHAAGGHAHRADARTAPPVAPPDPAVEPPLGAHTVAGAAAVTAPAGVSAAGAAPASDPAHLAPQDRTPKGGDAR